MTTATPLTQVDVNLGDRSYKIEIGHDCLTTLAERLSATLKPGRGVLITNPQIGGHWQEATLAALAAQGWEMEVCTIPEGENHKTTETLEIIYEQLIAHKHTRQSTIFALGGGVVGDITGYAAASFLRGVDFVQLPTSLLAMVDSSVGGKTGVNHRLGKNLIGAFWQPRYVGIDLHFLSTLAREEIICGLAEILKYGVIWDAEFFAYLEENIEAALAGDVAVLTHLVRRSCEIKAEVVAEDEREGGLRAILNYGHTFGHAAEALSHYGIRHGEGVGMGMVAAARLAAIRGMIDQATCDRIETLVARAGLPTQMLHHSFEAYRDKMASDKKSQRGKLRFVLPDRLGHVAIVDDVSDEDVEKSLNL